MFKNEKTTRTVPLKVLKVRQAVEGPAPIPRFSFSPPCWTRSVPCPI